MAIVLFVFAILEFIGGIDVFVGATSTIHQILGTPLIGFSIMTLGLAGILTENRRSRALLEKQVAESQKMREQRVMVGGSPPVPQVEPSSTYRGYSYVVRENGVDLTLQRGGTSTSRVKRKLWPTSMRLWGGRAGEPSRPPSMAMPRHDKMPVGGGASRWPPKLWPGTPPPLAYPLPPLRDAP
jgi:hypothetical protein